MVKEFEVLGSKFKFENGKLTVYTDVFCDYIPIKLAKITPDEMQKINEKLERCETNE